MSLRFDGRIRPVGTVAGCIYCGDLADFITPYRHQYPRRPVCRACAGAMPSQAWSISRGELDFRYLPLVSPGGQVDWATVYSHFRGAT